MSIRAFAYSDDNGLPLVGVEWRGKEYNVTQAWEFYKQIVLNGQGATLSFLQIMLEMDLFHSDVFNELFETLQQYRPLDDLVIRRRGAFSVPIARPGKMICVGRNYGRHAAELGNAVPDEPILFAKIPSALIAHEQKIVLPRGVGRVDYEGEIALVIGKEAKNVPREQALDYVAGYTLFNDVTARELQHQHKAKGLPWFLAKNFDTFGPLGPYLVPASEISHPDNLTLQTRVNGEVRQNGNTGDFLFPIPDLIATISKRITLTPGDIIATGTPEGVGPLQPGDEVEVEVKELGLLRNRVV